MCIVPIIYYNKIVSFVLIYNLLELRNLEDYSFSHCRTLKVTKEKRNSMFRKSRPTIDYQAPWTLHPARWQRTQGLRKKRSRRRSSNATVASMACSFFCHPRGNSLSVDKGDWHLPNRAVTGRDGRLSRVGLSPP